MRPYGRGAFEGKKHDPAPTFGFLPTSPLGRPAVGTDVWGLRQWPSSHSAAIFECTCSGKRTDPRNDAFTLGALRPDA